MRITDRTKAPFQLAAIVQSAERVVSNASNGNVYAAGDLPNITLRVHDSSKDMARRATSGRRTIGATWNAHRIFLDVLFQLAPKAIVRTSLTTYRGAADFNKRHKETYHHKVGPKCAPQSFGDL
jgi:hypothetical protein